MYSDDDLSPLSIEKKQTLLQELKLLLDDSIRELADVLRDNTVMAVGFSIDSVSLEDEMSVYKDGRNHVSVTQLPAIDAQEALLSAFGKFYQQPGMSTKYVSRYPGIICFNGRKEVVSYLVEHINNAKKNFGRVAKSLGPDRETRHERLHQALNGIITTHVTRNIVMLPSSTQRLWFGWRSGKPFHEEINKDVLIAQLEGKKDSPHYLENAGARKVDIEKVINDINNGKYRRLFKTKRYDCFPQLTYKYYNEDEQRWKRNCVNTNLPFLLYVQDKTKLPTYTPLESYTAALIREDRPLHIPKGMILIDETLKLIGEPTL